MLNAEVYREVFGNTRQEIPDKSTCPSGQPFFPPRLQTPGVLERIPDDGEGRGHNDGPNGQRSATCAAQRSKSATAH